MSDQVYLAELTVYDPGLPGTKVLRYSSQRGFVTRPSESPANTFYDARIKQAATIRRDVFAEGTTQGRGQIAYGDLVLLNGDGTLDELLDFGFDGRQIQILRGNFDAAYPGGYSTILVATMQQAEFSREHVTVRIYDRQLVLNVPLQTTKYAGNNTLPTGLEGTATDLKGKPKPLLYGQVFNVSPPCVNTSKLIYQVNDGAIASVDAVYDRGIALTRGLSAWTQRTSQFSTDTITGLAFGAGLFVAVGAAGKLSTSPTGVTWTSRTSSFSSDTINGVAFGDGIFVAVGNTGKLATSSDGISWTQRTSSFSTTDIYGIAYSATLDLWVAVGGAGKVATSPDGTTWTQRTSGVSSTIDLRTVIFGAGKFVVAGVQNTCITSTNGTSWTTQTVTVFSVVSPTPAWYGITYGRGLFVLVGSNGVIATSADAITWTGRDSADYSVNLRAVLFTANSTFVAVGAGGGLFLGFQDVGYITISSDALSWSAQQHNFTASINAISESSSDLVAAGASGLAATAASNGTFSTLADLQDDSLAPSPGTFKAYLAGGYIRLGSIPVGTVTADVKQGAAAGNRTVAQIWKQILERIGLTGSDYSSSDITALDAANSAVIGLYTGTEEIRAGDAADQVAGSVGAWWSPDRLGVFRVKQLVAPTATEVATFTASDMVQPLTRVPLNDPGQGLPAWRVKLRYSKNWTVQQSSELAAGVLDDRRAFLANEWREVIDEDSTVKTKHLLSPELVQDSLIVDASLAATEADRRQTLRGTRRDRFEFALQFDSVAAALELGDVIKIQHARFGLSAGKKFLVLGLEPNAENDELIVNGWG